MLFFSYLLIRFTRLICVFFVLQTSKRKLGDHERFHHLQYLIGSMLPFLKMLCKAQDEEIETEAKIQGIYRSSATILTR